MLTVTVQEANPMEHKHRFYPVGHKRTVVVQTVEYAGNYVGRIESRGGCIFGEAHPDRETAAAYAFAEWERAHGAEDGAACPNKR